MTTVYKKIQLLSRAWEKWGKKKKKKQLTDKEYLQSCYFYLLYWRSYYI